MARVARRDNSKYQILSKDVNDYNTTKNEIDNLIILIHVKTNDKSSTWDLIYYLKLYFHFFFISGGSWDSGIYGMLLYYIGR